MAAAAQLARGAQVTGVLAVTCRAIAARPQQEGSGPDTSHR